MHPLRGSKWWFSAFKEEIRLWSFSPFSEGSEVWKWKADIWWATMMHEFLLLCERRLLSQFCEQCYYTWACVQDNLRMALPYPGSQYLLHEAVFILSRRLGLKSWTSFSWSFSILPLHFALPILICKLVDQGLEMCLKYLHDCNVKYKSSLARQSLMKAFTLAGAWFSSPYAQLFLKLTEVIKNCKSNQATETEI